MTSHSFIVTFVSKYFTQDFSTDFLVIKYFNTIYLRVLVEEFIPEQNTTQTIRLIHR